MDQSRDSPSPIAFNVLCAEGDPRTDQSADIPETVVYSGDTATVLGVADLGEEERGGELRKRVAETHEESGAFKHGEALRGGLAHKNCQLPSFKAKGRAKLTWTEAAIIIMTQPAMIGHLLP